MTPVALLDKLKKLTQEDLESIHGIGPTLAQNIIEFTKSERYQDLHQGFTGLEDRGISILLQETTQVSGVLSGKTIVITGEFDISRSQIKKLLEAEGGKVSSSISAKTSYLLVGEKPGSKLKKAEKLEVAVVTDYKELLN